jgi:beta-N-acetylhexosaminidase
MIKTINTFCISAILIGSLQCTNGQTNKSTEDTKSLNEKVEVKLETDFTLTDYYSSKETLDKTVDHYFKEMSSSEKVAQLIMPAIGEYGQKESLIDSLVKSGKIGGLLLLNGTVNEFSIWVNKYNSWNQSQGSLPFLYSADAEPSLVNRKIKNSTPVTKANKIQSKQGVISTAKTIAKDLNKIGINYNFAPVVDMSPNKTVGWRSFGHVPDSVIPWSQAFIEATQKENIIATAKHFPGHGYVEGDTHKKLVYIDGEFREVKNYIPLIEDGVISIMIAHIAVKNNEQYSTDDMPASTSKKIVSGLLRDSLGFKGIVVTDAMNMGGVSSIKDANTLAIEAGCDILLMPLNAFKAHEEILGKYSADKSFQKIVDGACKRIIRAKLCLGLLNNQ